MFSPGPGTIVTGSTPASRLLLRDFDVARRAGGARVWDTPDILPRGAWLRRAWRECAWSDPVSTPLLLTRWQELALWEQAIDSASRDVLLNAHATASAARQAWQLLHAWDAASDAPSESVFDVSDDSRAFYSWMRQVRERLRERGWITSAELPGALLTRVRDRETVPIPDRVTFTAFDEIAPADGRLFEALGAREVPRPSCAGRAALAPCHDSADELAQAAVWARQKLEASPEPESLRLGVFVAGLPALAALAERIFDDILHPAWGFRGAPRAFAVSEGESLRETPIASAALGTLRLLGEVPRDDAALLWRSPFLRIEPGEASRLDTELQKRRAEHASVRMEPVRRRLPGMSAAAATLASRLRPSEWSAAFSRLLDLAGWPGARALNASENRALEAWKDLLSEFARLDAVLPAISAVRAISHLERMAAGTKVARGPEGADEKASVQILDLSETVNARFDGLWITGLDAGAWPPRPRPNPFLPLALQRAAGMPHASPERASAQAARVMDRLFASAPEVVCSFAEYCGDEQQRPSPLIAALPLAPMFSEPTTALRSVFLSAPELEARPLDEPVPLHAGGVQRGGVQVLADQSACPFRAFATHRLGARESDAEDLGLTPADRGSVLHRALELLWSELQTQERLRASAPEALEALIRASVAAALEPFFASWEATRARDQFHMLEQSRLEGLLAEWLKVEKQRPDFTVIQSENARTVETGGLQLVIRVDRVDQYANGTHAIIDYKTSKDISPKMWQGERPEAPQLPLYAATSAVPVSEVAFAQIAAGAIEWKGLYGNELARELPVWRAVTQKLAEDFRQGRADVDPRRDPNPCKECALPALCRIAEVRTLRTRGAKVIEEESDE